MHSQDFAPRIYDHGMAVGPAVTGMLAALSGGNDVRLVFDRPSPQEDFPMRPSRSNGERRRNEQDVDRPKGSIQFRKPDIVTN